MLMAKNPVIVELHKHCTNNEIEILQSNKCSCFFCRQTYNAREVNDWISDKRGVTAICPECGMDAVIGDACGIEFDKATLKEMNLAYYGEDYMEKHPNAAAKYVKRYQDGKITHKKANESLYIQYLSLLASLDNSKSAQAAFDLGRIYEFGTEFTEPNLKTAFAYYAMRPLKNDGDAICRLGVLALRGAFGEPDGKAAYECFSKSMALGSLNGLVKFIDCYSNGTNVNKDDDFAFEVADSSWPEIYQRFVLTNGKDDSIFAELAYRLGKMYLDGRGVEQNPFFAAKYFLMAQLGYEQIKSNNGLEGELVAEYDDCVQCIGQIASAYDLSPNEPIFDNDTFTDSQYDPDECAFLSGVPKTITLIERDKENNLASFDISYPLAPLIIDITNLFCGFVPGTITWEFVDVKSASIGKNVVFDTVKGNPAKGWTFYAHGPHGQANVASVEFFKKEPPKKDNGSFAA